MEHAEIEAAIGEVARKHNLLLSSDDPLMVLVTLNEMILARMLETQQRALEAALDQISAGAAQQVDAARDVAGVVITGGADYVAGEIRRATAVLKIDLLQAVETAKAEARQAADGARLAERRSWQIAIAVAVIASLLLGAAAAGSLQPPDLSPAPRLTGNTAARP
jgi:ABC-type glucose/galactose transport system permease subunit